MHGKHSRSSIMMAMSMTLVGLAMMSTQVESWSFSGKLPQLTSSLKRPSFNKRISSPPLPRTSPSPRSGSTDRQAAAIFSSETLRYDPNEEKWGPEITLGSKGLKMNLYGLFYGVLGISLGLIWWSSLMLLEGFYKLCPPWKNKDKDNIIDPHRWLPTTISYLWGFAVLSLTGCLPKVEGKENLKLLYDKENKKYRSAMFVANHTSFMDIYFVAMGLGFRNYFFVAKKELLKVPILARSMKTCHHILLDRDDRRSQLNAFKRGVKGLKTQGLNIVTFAEGTRSPDGVLREFKKGAFKMAQSAGAPIIPLSIAYAQDIQPTKYIFPKRPGGFGKRRARIVVGKPVETKDKSDDEVVSEIRRTMIESLPEKQRPDE